MRAELKTVLDSLASLPADELPGLAGELAEVQAHVTLRLTAPSAPKPTDELLDVDQAAERLNMSRKYVYLHAKEFPFTRRIGRKLLFSSAGIDRWLKAKR